MAIAASALLCGLYARGGWGWPLGFIALVPWLRALDHERAWTGTLLSAWAMSLAYSAAVFAWFGQAIGSYSQWGEAAGVALLLLAAPLFQPQFIVFALLRRQALNHHGRAWAALAGAAAWVASEALLPHVLGDTLGHGLYPARLLRQAADLGGAAGLTLLLLLSNEAWTAVFAQRAAGQARALIQPLLLAAAIPLLLAGYGAARLAQLPVAGGKPLRMGLVQSAIVDYEALRREKGTAAAVREVLDTHYAMSYDAVERQHVDALLWSETVYPTTFGQPKSETGAELDAEILAIVKAAGVPLVFGTFDRDTQGEYNAAAFVSPQRGLLGLYRKTRLFPFSEHVPAWLDSPALRQALPWTGHWRPGDGARVFPLQLADGRELPVQPLICLDDVDPQLAIDGARLGAQALMTMSNDSWFAASGPGAVLHHAVAAFRSIETRLPQFRVTSNGFSAIIDASGEIVAGARQGERSLVIAAVPLQEAPPTLMRSWGDWVGPTSAAALLLLALLSALQRHSAAAPLSTGQALRLPVRVALLPPAARLAAAILRGFARLALLALAARIMLGDGALQSNTLAQLRAFSALFLVPEAAAWCLLRAYAAELDVRDGTLHFHRGRQDLTLPLAEIGSLSLWRLPLPGPGLGLRLRSSGHWRYGLSCRDPLGLAAALHAAGRIDCRSGMFVQRYAQARRLPLPHWAARLHKPAAKFLLLPLLLALPAFRLHQHIAYGSSFGEYYSFGLLAYLKAFALWWAAWIIGVTLCAAVLRAVVEALTLALLRLHGARRLLDTLALALLYLGLPVWLALRLLGA
ncbi:apolipoprotein N-acyltransferase [Paucibacter sp. APW11]|uniref:Apolipoprotein N-acyltransferase n=1 Tax=Roseateles aquae TaxID=3077235 RepID=A0ABU3PB13_9BURK|nr:apolipoprotein N-acyltransferase [Paucibacter sp. APW11]MDT8999718.1 apolipoprotein N-acyltransferase [Paucibacter sp. APW11]